MTIGHEEQLAKAFAWMEDNPNRVYAASYDDVISSEMAGMLLSGDFDGFSEAVDAAHTDYTGSAKFWSSWEDELSTHLGYPGWEGLPAALRQTIEEERAADLGPWTRDAIRHWRGHVTARILNPADPEGLIYAPGTWTERDGSMLEQDRALARTIIDLFEPAIPEGEGTQEERLRGSLEIVYGGYDREALLIGGKVDLLAIWESGKKPEAVQIGPEDKGNLLFYDYSNGCGNMGELAPRKSVTMPATFEVDSTRRYSVDSCYGFTGKWWSHEIRVAELPAPEIEPETEEAGFEGP